MAEPPAEQEHHSTKKPPGYESIQDAVQRHRSRVWPAFGSGALCILLFGAAALWLDYWRTTHHRMPPVYRDDSGSTTITFTPCRYMWACDAYLQRQGHPTLTLSYQDLPQQHAVSILLPDPQYPAKLPWPATGDAWWDGLATFLDEHNEYPLSDDDHSLDLDGDHFKPQK